MFLRSEIDIARERWELIPGSSFDKTLTLLSSYAGLDLIDGKISEDFFSFIKSLSFFKHHQMQVFDAIKDFYGKNGILATSPDFCTVDYLLSRVKKELGEVEISAEGELQAIFILAQESELMMLNVNQYIPSFEPLIVCTNQPFKLINSTNLIKPIKIFAPTETKIIDLIMGPCWKHLKDKFFNQVFIFLQGLSIESSVLFHFPKELYFVIGLFMLDFYQKDHADLYKQKIKLDFPIETNLQNLGLFKMPQTNDVFYEQALFKRPVLCPSENSRLEEKKGVIYQYKK